MTHKALECRKNPSYRCLGSADRASRKQYHFDGETRKETNVTPVRELVRDPKHLPQSDVDRMHPPAVPDPLAGSPDMAWAEKALRDSPPAIESASSRAPVEAGESPHRSRLRTVLCTVGVFAASLGLVALTNPAGPASAPAVNGRSTLHRPTLARIPATPPSPTERFLLPTLSWHLVVSTPGEAPAPTAAHQTSRTRAVPPPLLLGAPRWPTTLFSPLPSQVRH
ncbi:MAG: hypothetical protein JWM85_72 [Acidimicrobiaceae bacterium]|nr:hypothetical protein [Acidimicrobiaceae bacterium]